jgi:hypothetical protein
VKSCEIVVNLNQATQQLVHDPRIERKILRGVVLSISCLEVKQSNSRSKQLEKEGYEEKEKGMSKKLPKKEILYHRIGNTERIMEILNFLIWKFV